MIRYIFIIICLTFISSYSIGQYKPKTKKKQFYGNPRLSEPLFRWVTGDYSKHGLQVAFGPNYTLTRIPSKDYTFQFKGNDPTDEQNIHTSVTTKSKLGGFVELGMVHITKRPRKIIHYYDWGIGYKMIGGGEITQTDIYNYRDSLVSSTKGVGDFYNGYVYGRFAAHNVFQFNRYNFLDNSLGFNFDYMVQQGKTSYPSFVANPSQPFQGKMMFQLNYAFGFGIKPDPKKGFFIIPSVEVPILGAYEWRGGTPQIHWFNSKYYPITAKVRLVWLFKKDPNRCPPVENNEDDKQRAREYESK
ncbi:MAG: hypothetical protein H3C31_05115 [Brumimicrobium sp.]|nr:hypothetical protein [Brumimicrobium sp.]MCO5269815.1 hypothetical protein [Brumimicrobium sp.]